MAKQPQAVVVVPTNSAERMQEFLNAWDPELGGIELILVEDQPERTFVPNSQALVSHYSWREIDELLGPDGWIVPRRTGCVRSFGIWAAWHRHADMIVTLDDHCRPGEQGPEGFLAAHWQRLEAGGEQDAFVSTMHGTEPRGIPYRDRTRRHRCVINAGLLADSSGCDAITQLSHTRATGYVAPIEQTIARGSYYPMHASNLAFRPEIAPAMYFTLMGEDWGIDGFGDIWCGLLSKRICDHFGFAVNSGSPIIGGKQGAHVWSDLRKEAAGIEHNEKLWHVIDDTRLTAATVTDCYRQLAEAIAAVEDEHMERLGTAMHVWASRFDAVEIPSQAPQQRAITTVTPSKSLV